MLGRYKDSGLPGLEYKDCGSFTSVYSGRGGISAEALAEIAARAQVQLYTVPGVASYINSRVIGIYSDKEERIHVRIDGMYEDVFSGNQYQSQNGMLMIPEGNSRAKMLIRR